MIAKMVSSTWPAVMFAKRRTARVSGRSRYFEKNSIGMTRNFSGSGTPEGLMFEKKYFGPCLTNPVTMKVIHDTSARNSGMARRDVAGNWMNGTTDQMLMKKIQKNRVAKNGVHDRPDSPIAAMLTFSSTAR